jgi:hypothetical protein
MILRLSGRATTSPDGVWGFGLLSKVDYAEKVIDFISKENMDIHKLPESVNDLLHKIKIWNKLK